MKEFFKNLFKSQATKNSEFALELLQYATEFEKVARDYDLSDPYLAGKNAGRAEMLRLVVQKYFSKK